ncbi:MULTISPECIES: [FeFe] hydrogenase, group A [unclassified Adlercreutzia]|uniref:[FeFe] hydrogenase, group A n=1 Tax=unclassified Adlercreutzia TaxID=2636013 RepID=UPI0013E9EEC0|nr:MULTISPECIES: [FeFe] hydrogenase, group A [unclassified Adlercreutzia]
MVELIIDDVTVSVEEGATLLQAARAAGAEIPTLCYFEGLNEIGACRVCVVEVEGEDRLSAACNTAARPGMRVRTDTERVREARMAALQLILSQHDLNCAYCTRDGTCRLQKLLLAYDLIERDELFDMVTEAPSPYAKQLVRGKRSQWKAQAPIQRRTNLCVKCGRCVAACKRLEGIGVWDFVGSGAASNVGVRNGSYMKAEGCVACGQCITHCPTGALSERDDIQLLRDAIADPDVTTVAQIAPATRTSWGVGLGAEEGALPVERMAAALKKLGVDYVFDTSFSADLTIMEEATELLHVLAERAPDENGVVWPMFTSCCPAWVTHVKNAHPDVLDRLSTAKSPMMMFGAVAKTWFAQKRGLDPARVFSVALMPCTAKKTEVKLPMAANEGVFDMDASLTTRELQRLIRDAGVDVAALEDVPLDDPLGSYTGAGVIFGTTGGVMEAALRSAHCFVTGSVPADPEGFAFSPAGAGRPWKEASFDLAGTRVRCAVASGLANAGKLLDAIRAGEAAYEFVEVMACPSGCAGGGGQPIDGTDRELGLERGQVLRGIDRTVTSLRYSHENPVIKVLYEEFLGDPCGERAHQLLHVDHRAKG